jgi:hypothetical protein
MRRRLSQAARASSVSAAVMAAAPALGSDGDVRCPAGLLAVLDGSA